MKKILGASIFCIVGIVIIAGFATPLISSMSDNIVSVDNNTNQRFLVKDSGANLIVTYEGNDTYSFNNYEITADLFTRVICDNFMMHAFTGGSVYYFDNQNNAVLSNMNVEAGQTVLEITRGVFEYTVSGTTYSGEVQKMLYPSGKGTYGAFESTSSYNVSVDDPAYVVMSATGSIPLNFVLTMVNGSEVRNEALLAPKTTSGANLSDYNGTVTLNITGETSEDGKSFAYSDVTFSTTGTTEVTDSAPRLIYAPIYYDVMDSNAEAARSIVNVIPIVLVIFLLIAVCGYLFMAMGKRSEL